MPVTLDPAVLGPFRPHNMSSRFLTALAALTLGASLPAPGRSQQPAAQQPNADTSDTAMALPIKPVRTLRFTTDEATWI